MTQGVRDTVCGECILFGAIQGLSDGLVLVDTSGKIFHINRRAEELMGGRGKVTIGAPAAGALAKAGLDNFWNSAVNESDPVSADIPLPGGSILHATVTKCLSAKGELIGHALTLRDVTREKRVHVELSGDVARRLLELAGAQRPEGGAPALTHRETQILSLLAAGLTNRQIATKLHVSPNTVATHLKHLYPKLRVKTRSQASAYAVTHGLGDSDT